MRLEESGIPAALLAQLERLIQGVKWRDSTTYPAHMQHASVLKKDFPKVFAELVAAIEQYGYRDQFYGQSNAYLVIGRYKYWAYDTVLNREEVQLTLDRQQKGGLW